MTKSCGILPDAIGKEYNQRAKQYKESGMAPDAARSQAAQDFLKAIQEVKNPSTTNDGQVSSTVKAINSILSDNLNKLYGIKISHLDALNPRARLSLLKRSATVDMTKPISADVAEFMSWITMGTLEFDQVMELLEGSAYQDKIFSELSSMQGTRKQREAGRIAIKTMLELGLNKAYGKNGITDQLFDLIKSVVLRIQALLGKVDFQALETLADSIIDKTLKGQALVSPKEDYVRINAGKVLAADPHAMGLVNGLAGSKDFALTGSLSYATEGSVYRHKDTTIHDLDFVTSLGKEAAEAVLLKLYPQSYKFNTFLGKDEDVTQSYVVPPKGYKITDYTSEALKTTGYNVVNEQGKVVGTYTQVNGKETSTGVKAALVDLMTETTPSDRKTVKFPTPFGDERNASITTHATSFAKKLEYGRNKDVVDYALFKLNEDVLGSSNGTSQTTTPIYTEVIDQNINTIYMGLETLGNKTDTVSHSKHLADVMYNMVVPLMDQLKGMTFTVSEGANFTRGEFDPNNRSIGIQTSMNPIFNGLQMSAQEVAAHEFSHAILQKAVTQGPSNLKKGLSELFDMAKANIKPEDLMQAPVPGSTIENERKAAVERYNYIFNSKDSLQEFVAFGLTNENFLGLLRKIKIKKPKPDIKNAADLIKYLFNKAIDWFFRRIEHVQGDDVAAALYNLSYELAGLKKKHENILDKVSKGFELLKTGNSKSIDLILKPLIDYSSNPNRNNKLTRTVKLFQNAKVGAKALNLAQAIGDVANNINRHRRHFFLNLIVALPQELLGQNSTNERWHAQLRRSKQIIDGARHKMKEGTIYNVRTAFIDPITDEEKRSLYGAMLVTDLDSLLQHSSESNTYDLDRIRKLLDSSERAIAIKQEEDLLQSMFGKVGNHYIKQARGLGKYMVTKTTFNQGFQMRNAHNIANGSGAVTDESFQRPTNWKEAIPIIERLKTLHALEQVDQSHREATVKVFDREMKNPEENGIINLLTLNASFKQEALAKLFNGNPALVEAGYVRDINKPDVTIEFSKDPKDEKLLKLGFDEGVKAPKSKLDPNKEQMYMYVSNYNGLVPYTKMVTSMTSRQVAGSTFTDIYNRDINDTYVAHQQAIQATNEVKAKIKNTDLYSLNYDENDVSGLIPLTNDRGDIVNYRYMMSEQNRVSLLGKETRVDQVMAAMYESITDKVNTVTINNEVVQELIHEHKTLFAKNPKGFITITKNHPKYGEIYSILPKEMKEQLDNYFGNGQLIVRESMINIIFGYRKYSLTRDGINSPVMKIMKLIYMALFRGSEGNFNKRSRIAEQGWQELVGEIKSVIVLKTSVLLNNIISNFIVSLMHGIPLNYLTKKQSEAVLAVDDYVNKSREIIILEQRMKTIGASQAFRDNTQGKINKLQFEIDNSSIKEMVKAGLLNSIVEDIDVDDTDFGIKGELVGMIVNRTKAVPKIVKDVYAQASINRKTGLYKLLEKSTRYSDFVARHAMYEWYTKEKEMPKDEALKIVIEQFINYDLPTSKELQFLNDMGLFMFTKYALRIQKTIYRMVRDNPKNVIGLFALEHLFGDVSDPTDSFTLFPGGPDNPLGALDELVLPGVQLFQDVTGLKII